jgi:hypothetical protein
VKASPDDYVSLTQTSKQPVKISRIVLPVRIYLNQRAVILTLGVEESGPHCPTNTNIER